MQLYTFLKLNQTHIGHHLTEAQNRTEPQNSQMVNNFVDHSIKSTHVSMSSINIASQKKFCLLMNITMVIQSPLARFRTPDSQWCHLFDTFIQSKTTEGHLIKLGVTQQHIAVISGKIFLQI